MKNKTLYILLIVFLVGCSESTSKSSEREVRHYHKNGQLKYRCLTDTSGNIHGYCYQYDEKGVLTRKSIHFHGKEMIGSSFKQGKLFQLTSRFVGDTLTSNVVVTFDNYGNVLEEKSHYANIHYAGKNKDSLYVDLPTFYKDSIIVLFWKSFVDVSDKDNYTRRVRFVKSNEPKITFAIRPEDYSNGKLNIQINTYDTLPPQTQPKNSTFKIYFPPGSKNMLIQLDKDEIPSKYNIDPIWY